ncbi:MAG: hypothetical protein AB1414_17650, partial [bacterium]
VPQRDNDYFKLNIPKKGTFSAVVSEVPKEINPFFAMYDSNKDWMRSARGDYGQGVSIQFTSLPAGDYYLRLCAQDDGQSAQAYRLTTNFGSPEITLPMAKITSPQPNSLLSGTITILGTAAAENFLNYIFQYGTGSKPISWLTITTSTTPVINGTLATWNTTLLEDGTYTLCLTVKDKLNNIATDTVVIGIDNTPPVAKITFPEADSEILQGTITILGTADDEHLLNWILEDGAGYTPQTYTLVASSTISVISGTLGSIFLPTGSYTLKLTVSDITNNVATDSVSFIVIFPTPAEILQKVAESFGKIEDMKATIITTGSIGTESYSEIAGSFLMKKPDKVKIITPVKDETIIINGEKMYVITNDEVEEVDVGIISDISPSSLDFYYYLDEFKEMHEIEIKEEQDNIYILEATPKTPQWKYEKMVIHINYLIGLDIKKEVFFENTPDPQLTTEIKDYQLIEDVYIPTKLVEKIVFEDATLESISTYTNIQLNTGIPDSEFEP